MIKTNKDTYLITPSLLNAWIYAIESDYGTVEDFLNTLNRVPTPTNESIQKGFEFEKWCEKNYDEVQDGMFQCAVKKQVNEFLLYGRIDCVKAGIVYDFKYTANYEVGKYLNNMQTPMYLELIPEAKEMKYIIANRMADTPSEIYIETYTRDETKPIIYSVYEFMNWLEIQGYMNLYKEKWLAYR